MEEKTVVIRQKFSPQKEKAAEMLAHGANQREAARRLQGRDGKPLHYQTVWGWCQDPDFKARIEEYKTDSEGQAREIISGGLLEAARTVVDASSGKLNIDSKELAPRLKAALWILDFLKEKRLPSPAQPKKRSGIKPSISDDEAREHLEV